jgi:hypothetical protein
VVYGAALEKRSPVIPERGFESHPLRRSNPMGKINVLNLLSEDPKIKYGCAKNLIAVAKENPAEIYPNLDFLVELLDSENNIIRWTAIDIIGHLARVDEAKKIDALMGKLFGLLNTGNMITANHAIMALANIALARPEHHQKITDELLKVEHYNYDTEECRNIAIGTAIQAIGSYFNGLRDREAAIEFARRQTKNSRNATRKKAEKFLAKYKVQN